LGFHAQQAVEKSLKAVLASRGAEFPFTHDLEGLIERCRDTGAIVPDDLVASAGLLTPYAVRHRYGAPPPELVDRATASTLAQTAVAWAKKELQASGSD
jgi:HEPN domain-containing protein